MKMDGWLLVVFSLHYLKICQPQGRHTCILFYSGDREKDISVLNTALMAV